MTQTIREIEQEIERSRARLDETIDRIQDRLSVSGIVDQLMGSVRSSDFSWTFDNAVSVVRRNPIPVLLVAAGVGWLIHRATSKAPTPGAGGRFDPYREDEADVPVLNTGHARVYDPDTSPRHPTHDSLDSRRDVSARA